MMIMITMIVMMIIIIIIITDNYDINRPILTPYCL